MTHDRKAAKEKELATRVALGPRLGHKRDTYRHKVTAPPKVPRATGAPSSAIRDGRNNGA